MAPWMARWGGSIAWRRELRRLLVCAPALAAGLLLLGHGLPATPDALEAAHLPWLAAALGLLAAAVGLAQGRAGAWVAAGALAVVTIALAIVDWVQGSGADWGALLAGTVLLLALAAPSVREEMLAGE